MLSKHMQYLHRTMQMVLSAEVWTIVIAIVIVITFNVIVIVIDYIAILFIRNSNRACGK